MNDFLVSQKSFINNTNPEVNMVFISAWSGLNDFLVSQKSFINYKNLGMNLILPNLSSRPIVVPAKAGIQSGSNGTKKFKKLTNLALLNTPWYTTPTSCFYYVFLFYKKNFYDIFVKKAGSPVLIFPWHRVCFTHE